MNREPLLHRRITVVLETSADQEGDTPLLEALDVAMRKTILNPGERYEVVSDERI